MGSPISFLATPSARKAAFIFDLIAIFLLFAGVSVAADSLHRDVASLAGFAFCAWLYNIVLPAHNTGSTLGKGSQNIAVVSATGQPASLVQYAVRSSVRFLPLALLSIPYSERMPSEAILGISAKIAIALFWLAEWGLLNSVPARQTVSDRAARTVVVNLPEAHSHRAPAGPMFSATDREFGIPPKVPKHTKRSGLAPNHSNEATAQSPLRALWAALMSNVRSQ